MKRILFAAGSSLIFHVLLLGLIIALHQNNTFSAQKTEPLIVSLLYRYPENPADQWATAHPMKNEATAKKPETYQKPVKKIIIKEPPQILDNAPLTTKNTEVEKLVPDPQPDPEHEGSVEITDPEPVSASMPGAESRNIFGTGHGTVSAMGIPAALHTFPFPLEEAYPVYESNPAPEYPGIAKRRGYEGIVILDVFVDKRGEVRELNISQSSGHKILDNTAMNAVKDWLFEPGRRGDEKIEMLVKVPVRFELN